MKVLMWIWQLPQNLLGLLVILFTRARKQTTGYWEFYDGQRLQEWILPKKYRFGVSLGNFIIVSDGSGSKTIRHEWGHQRQSLRLGWLYLVVIGLPSAAGNLWDRFMHINWSNDRRIEWYYSQHWERWADKLGGVER